MTSHSTLPESLLFVGVGVYMDVGVSGSVGGNDFMRGRFVEEVGCRDVASTSAVDNI